MDEEGTIPLGNRTETSTGASHERHLKTSKHEKIFNFLVINEMQVKTKVRSSYIPTRVVEIFKSDNIRWQQRCGAVGIHLHN